MHYILHIKLQLGCKYFEYLHKNNTCTTKFTILPAIGPAKCQLSMIIITEINIFDCVMYFSR